MARTALFSALRRAYRTALSRTGRTPTEPRPELAPNVSSRRNLLKAAGFGLPAAAFVSACGDDTSGPTPEGEEKVVIIGGGIAGLHCAYQLKAGGIKAVVYEAQNRVGGRMFTARGAFEAAPDQLCELGGELIDSGHETLRALADEFGLTLDDRLTEEDAGFKRDTWYIDGVAIPDEIIVEQFVAVAPAMAADYEAAENDDDAYTTLDEQNLDDYLVERVPPATYPELHAILQNAYRGEYGLENNKQSSLNLVYLIGSDDPDPFRIFGVSDERYHTHLGNDSFPTKLAEGLDEDQIFLEHALKSATEKDGGGYELVFDFEGGEVVVEATRIVFAIPFTKLREVDLSGLTLSEDKRAIIDELGYGTNAKVMIGFSSRVWRTDHDSSGALTTDLPIQQTWETTIGQEGEHGILTNFLGGDTGLNSDAGEPEDWADNVVPDLETVWPGTAAAYTGEAVRMHWPTVPTMKGSYACYKPGQWYYFGTEGVREGNIHFCGEHTSQDFQGYMEGGAETGALVAAEILEELDANMPQSLVDVLGVKLIIPQACYRANRFGRVNAFQRKRIAREQVKLAYERLRALDVEAGSSRPR